VAALFHAACDCQPGGLDARPCRVHLQLLDKEYLAAGEHFPFGAHGAELLACVACEPKDGLMSVDD
jgi:hypothetical protein